MKINLLDCTLRDGGYVNDWEFGYDNLVSIFERLVNADVDIIEVGFLDERRPFDINRSIAPDDECFEKIYGKVDKKDAIVVGMIDYGTCGIEHLRPCKESFLDGIRVIFKKHIMHEAIAFCKQVKALGYKVFTQAVSITSYNDDELLELIGLVNDLKPYALSMVDTYGLLEKGNLMHYFTMLDKYLDPEVGLGYHSHNNFQLAYANCTEVLKTNINRMVIVDATLYGMGKSAGNAPVELLGMHLNDQYGKNYDMNQILEAIDGNIMKIYQKTPWGYNLFFYVAASNKCHPNYVQYLMDKHTLSIKSVNEILAQIEDEKKLMYDQKHIEYLYYEYQKTSCDDKEAREILKQKFCDKQIVVIGPGPSVLKESDKIKNYIEANAPIVIAINYIPEDIAIDYVFLSNPRRYINVMNRLKDDRYHSVKVIATSNVTKARGTFDYTLNNEALLDYEAEIIDNSFVMLLKVLADKNAKSVMCAGLDGYSKDGGNYADENMEYWFARRKADELNQYVRDFLDTISDKLYVDFLTYSRYNDGKNKK